MHMRSPDPEKPASLQTPLITVDPRPLPSRRSHEPVLHPVVTAPRTDTPVRIDGRLDETIWQAAPRSELVLPQSLVREGKALQEPGAAQFAWDAEFLYVAFDLQDSDIVAEGTADGQMHNTLGDTCELLIKPEQQTWYWEFHITPSGHTSVFFFPGRGRLCLPSCLVHASRAQVAARVEGTLNDWTDRDTGWTAEMAIPLAELTMHGESLTPGARWRILVGRYNYSRYLTTRGPELSATPPLSKVDFHRFEEYALLQLAD